MKDKKNTMAKYDTVTITGTDAMGVEMCEQLLIPKIKKMIKPKVIVSIDYGKINNQ